MNNNNSKQLLLNNPNLVAVRDNEEILFHVDNQFLYLYPLNIIDYANSIKNKKPIKLVVKNLKTEDIEKILDFINNAMSKDEQINRCVEFEIKDEIQNANLLEDLFKTIVDKKIKIVLNFKTYTQFNNFAKCFKYVDNFKFSIHNCKEFNKFIKKVKIKSGNSQLLFAKIYLDIKQINMYYSFVKKLKKLNFDYVLFTKNLLPDGIKNENIDLDIKYKLSKIKYKLENENFKVKLVKDFTTLYYPLFKLDKRNTRNCYASKVCNYLIDGKLYPCATRQIVSCNISLDNSKSKNYIGTKCSDCASIFENDYLEQIYKINFDRLKFVKPSDALINPLGIGTFKYLSNYKQIRNNFIIGQNLIDCNLAYNNKKTLKNLAKYIPKRKNVLLYCKLYKDIYKVEDIEKQVDEYLKILKVKSLQIVSIHSLDILKNVELIDAYKELQRLQKCGKIEHLGLCNASKEQLERIIESDIKLLTFEGVYNLVCKYYEISGVLDVCKKNNIKFIAYQPLLMSKFNLMHNSILKQLSLKYNKTISQILLNYYIMHKKMIVLVKSSNLKHIIENSNYDFYIKDEDYLTLDDLNDKITFKIDFNDGENKVYLLSYKILKNLGNNADNLKWF